MSRRFQFSLRGLFVAMTLFAALLVMVPLAFEFFFPTPSVLSATIVVEGGVRYHQVVWSNGATTRVVAGAGPVEARNGRGRWRPK